MVYVPPKTVHDVQDFKLTSVTTSSDTSQPAAGCDDTIPNTVKSVTFADEGAIGIKPLGTVKVYQCDGRRRKSRSWTSRAQMKGIVDTGATLHLLKDESTPELIDTVESNKPVTGFSGNMSQRVAREGYQHMHFCDPQNTSKKGVKSPESQLQAGNTGETLHDTDAINIPASSSDFVHRPKLHYFMPDYFTT